MSGIRISKIVWFSIAFFAAATLKAGEGLNLHEGNWETLVTIQKDEKSLPLPAIKSAKCITREDPLPNAVQPNDRCQITGKEVKGNDVAWQVRCADMKGVMEGAGKVTYAGDTFGGNMQVSIRDSGDKRKMDMIYVLKGRRTGACP